VLLRANPTLNAAEHMYAYVHSVVDEYRANTLTGVEQLASVVNRLYPLLHLDDFNTVVTQARAELFGLGPLEAVLADTAVTEVMVNGTGDIWIERHGRLSPVDVVLDAEQVLLLIERILAPLGLRVDRLHPTVDARLHDGSRVHAVIPPVAVDGPCLTIRRFAQGSIPLEQFADASQCRVLRFLMEQGKSVVVCGATGSGKTTLLNALAAAIPSFERIVTIEDTAELRLPHAHVVRLEARIATIEGIGEVTLRDLVKTSLRMRPDRIIVGEVRGPEALDMVQAMSTGHRGSMSTVHADGSADALKRLELMLMMAGVGLSLGAMREQLAMALDVVVHVARQPDGSRGVIEIVSVGLDQNGNWQLNPIGISL
jgi:pilus assembly protein CpaF